VKAQAAERAADLLRRHRVAALGTTHDGAPSVTMAPFALVVDPFALVVLLSGLSSHTKDLRADRRAGVLIAEAETDGLAVHTLARVSIQGEARELAAADPAYDRARQAYATRFPDMIGLFGLADFALFAIEPATVRVVLGFAQASSISPTSLAAALKHP
jgi:putative heme iron utilization protein